MEFEIKRTGIAVALTLTSVLPAIADITDSIHSIPEIEIQATRMDHYLIGASVHVIDSSTLGNYETQSLAGLLSNQSLVTVNSYGPGGQASISIRGGGAHHATVIWNGINIQSPMHGGINFSELPVSFIDKAQIQLGGASTLFGSGNATGSIHLAEDLGFNQGHSGAICGYAGSNNNFIQSGRILLSKKRWVSSMKVFAQQNKNNFRFINTEKGSYPGGELEHPIERLEHGGYHQYGISQSNKVRLGNNSWLGTAFWFIDYHKDIPSLMDDYNTGESAQEDRNIMYSVYYKYANRLWQVKLLSGGFYNQVDYKNPVLELSNSNSSYSLIDIAELNVPVHKSFDVGFIVEQKYETAQSGSYQNRVDRDIISTILSARYHINPFIASINLREELVDGSFIPVVFSGGVDILITSEIAIKSQISKNYTLPTMNDLYWENDGFSAGNPNLKPETGWSGETGIYYTMDRNKTNFKSDITVFSSMINNWIRWIPVRSNFWMPLNVQKGQSRGIEASAGINYKLTSIELDLDTRYGYTSSVTLEPGETRMLEEEQMWYVPKHHVNISFGVAHRYALLDYTQSIVGKRMYDNAAGTLEPYTIGNILLKSQLPLKSIKIEFLFTISNIWNTKYQIMHSYAMPLQQFMTGIKIMFNN